MNPLNSKNSRSDTVSLLPAVPVWDDSIRYRDNSDVESLTDDSDSENDFAGSVHGGPEAGVEEEVVVDIAQDGSVIPKTDAVSDYIYCPVELEACSS